MLCGASYQLELACIIRGGSVSVTRCEESGAIRAPAAGDRALGSGWTSPADG